MEILPLDTIYERKETAWKRSIALLISKEILEGKNNMLFSNFKEFKAI